MEEQLLYTEKVGGSNPSARTTFMGLKQNTKEYTCHYGHRFLCHQVKLVPFKNDSKELLGHVIFVSSDEDKLYRGGRAPEGYLMACPHCNTIHLGGFTVPSTTELKTVTIEELKRNIQLQL